MESVQDSFNWKIVSLERRKATLMNLYEEYEQERKSTLSEAEAFERSAMDCGDWDLASTCETTKVILEDIRILVVEASEQKKDDNWQAKIRKKAKT